MWPHTYLAGGRLMPERAEVRRKGLQLPSMQAIRGKFHKSLKKVKKSSSKMAHDVRRRQRQLRSGTREASLLASYVKIMSPPEANFSKELHDNDDNNHEAIVAEIEALIEEQERKEEEEKALNAQLRSQENELRAPEGAESLLPSPLHENVCWVQSGDRVTLLRSKLSFLVFNQAWSDKRVALKVDEHLGVHYMIANGEMDAAVGVVSL